MEAKYVEGIGRRNYWGCGLTGLDFPSCCFLAGQDNRHAEFS